MLVANPRRRELIGIVDWRLSELDHLGVTIQYNTFADTADVLALNPDIVVVATGGLPQPPEMTGTDLTVSTWDILSGDVKPAENVLVYDDYGAHAGLSAAEVMARAGANVEIVTPERMFAPDIGGLNHAPYMQRFQETGVQITQHTRVTDVRRDGNALVATFASDYAKTYSETRRVDQVVVEHGTTPMEDLYHDLKPHAKNHGEVDYKSLITSGEIFLTRNPDGQFILYRIGDAIAARNIHAGIYDAMRYGLRW